MTPDQEMRAAALAAAIAHTNRWERVPSLRDLGHVTDAFYIFIADGEKIEVVR